MGQVPGEKFGPRRSTDQHSPHGRGGTEEGSERGCGRSRRRGAAATQEEGHHHLRMRAVVAAELGKDIKNKEYKNIFFHVMPRAIGILQRIP